jgi:5S rRNA maturation endonuclease (ribonuclease M5)
MVKVKYPHRKGHNNYPWAKEIIPKYVLPFIELKKSKGLKPTVRGTCYYLEQAHVIEKSTLVFIKCTKALGTARDRGQIAMDAFADTTRQIIKNFNDKYYSLTDNIKLYINALRTLPNGYQRSIPRWLGQTNYVEVWIEKESMASSVELALKGLDVIIAPNKGWSSKTFVYTNLQRLKAELTQNPDRKKVYVLYMGDLDPAGWAMDKKIKKQLENLGTRAVFKRIAVTKKQLKQFHLEHLTNPDTKIIKKFSNPKNRFVKPFIREFGSVFQIELEVLDALPDFQNIIRAEVDSLYDSNVYEDVLSRPEHSQQPDVIREQIKQAVNEFLLEGLAREGEKDGGAHF